MNKLSEIPFKELENFNDSNSIICIGLLLAEDQVDGFEGWMKEIGLISGDKKIVKCHFITGNVRGDARKGADSRADWLIEFDHPEIQFSPMARLMYGEDFKWTSDFIHNFRKDYNY